jgi:hypothetical protein
MRTATAITLALLLASPAVAVDPDTLTTEDKALYLKCAYVLNDNLMVTRSSIDLSKWSKDELMLCIEPKPFVEAVPTEPARKRDKGK